jgi:hypothetical protein
MCSYKETTRKIKNNKQRKSSKVAKKSYNYANSQIKKILGGEAKDNSWDSTYN